VILAGGGVIMAGATAEAIALAEMLGAPVCNSYLHNDSFPASHALAVGPLGYQGSKAAMKLIAQADVVLALGTRLGPLARCRSTGSTTGRKRPRSCRSIPTRACSGS
jgi:sulfoacetaldehyde acetyltransferase